MATTCSIHSGSCSLARHMFRGVIAVIATTLAFLYSSAHPMLALFAVIAAVIALGGCPTCWLAGLFDHITRSRDASARSSR